MSQAKSFKAWIISPKIDLLLLSFGWLFVFLTFYFLNSSIQHPTINIGISHLIFFTLGLNFLHRMYTLLFVYGDPEEFNRKKTVYIALPVFLLLLTTSLIVFAPQKFIYLTMLSIAWTIYHTLMQKVGILRIYSKKKTATAGSWLDKALVWVFMLVVFFKLASIDSTYYTLYSAGDVGRNIVKAIKPFKNYIQMFSNFIVAFGALFSIFYFIKDYQNKSISLPKYFYIASTLSLYSLLFYDFIVAYAIFSVSHSIEYLCFTNHVLKKKNNQYNNSFIKSFSKHLFPAFLIYCILLSLVFIFWQRYSQMSFTWFIVGSGYLHFIYDGWLWKLRNKKVSKQLNLKTS